MTDKTLFSELKTASRHRIGVITLDSEKTLNALDQGMLDALYDRLQRWRSDPDIACIMMQGEGEKAFCAGGDIRSLRQAILAGDSEAATRFFEKEYRLDYLIHTYNKPVVCWGNGIVMGGGIGLMSGAAFRVVTDTSVMAMPEVSIGLYPDVGGSWQLGRMPEGIGLFMALTGCRLNAADAIYLGLGNRFIDHAFRNNILEALQAASWGEDDYSTVYDIVQHFADNSAGWLPYSKIREYRDLIGTMMNQPALESIIKTLEELNTEDEWLQACRSTALAGSPLSSAIAYRQLQVTRHCSLKEAFQSELSLSVNCTLHGDVNEGVRALLVDKNRNPDWRFASVKDIPPEELDKFFQPPWGAGSHPLEDL
ncbi:MAG: enoyl-CoA hydratase/isomerase family protein [Endozoicomonas sp.]